MTIPAFQDQHTLTMPFDEEGFLQWRTFHNNALNYLTILSIKKCPFHLRIKEFVTEAKQHFPTLVRTKISLSSSDESDSNAEKSPTTTKHIHINTIEGHPQPEKNHQ